MLKNRSKISQVTDMGKGTGVFLTLFLFLQYVSLKLLPNKMSKQKSCEPLPWHLRFWFELGLFPAFPHL